MRKFADIRVMARGWDHEDWVAQGFYPDDLPEDWRLPYYANEFRAVLVPAALWRVADAETVQAWLDDVPEEFQFFLELADVSKDIKPALSLAQTLKGHLGGFLLQSDTGGDDWQRLVKPLLKLLLKQGPLGVLLPPGVSGSEAINSCRRLDPDALSEGEDTLCYAWVAGDMTYTPRQWREKMERLRDEANGHGAVLVFDGDPPDVEAMRVVSAIVDMLGPAS